MSWMESVRARGRENGHRNVCTQLAQQRKDTQSCIFKVAKTSEKGRENE